MLCQISEPITAVQLSEAKLRSCFAIVDKNINFCKFFIAFFVNHPAAGPVLSAYGTGENQEKK